MAPIADVDVQATVSMQQGTEMGVCARLDTAGNGYCFATSWGGGAYPQIAKFSADEQNPTGIASSPSAYPIAQNTDYVVELKAQGNSISGRIYPVGTSAPVVGPHKQWTVRSQAACRVLRVRQPAHQIRDRNPELANTSSASATTTAAAATTTSQ